MKVVIDRFEGEFAVCETEDRTMINILRKDIPDNAKEGDILIIDGQKILIDSQATQERKQKIEKLMEDLWE